MKKIFLLFLILFSFNLVYSQDVYYINSTQTVEIDEHNVCYEVTNNAVFNLMVPTKSSLEWSDFINDSPSFVSFADCGTNNFGDGSDGNIWVKSDGIYQDLGSGYNKLYDGTQWPSIEDGDMIVINARDFQVDSGVTFTTTNRCRGLMIYTTGDMIVDGNISMTARGAFANPSVVGLNSDGNSVPDEGLVIRRFKSNWDDVNQTILDNAHSINITDFYGNDSSNDLFYGGGKIAVLTESNQEEVENGLVIKIPKVGGAGGSVNNGGAGKKGQSKLFSPGGGASGGQAVSYSWRYSHAGGHATCFSGGVGTAGACDGLSDYPANNYGGPASPGGGRCGASGAAGNPGSYGACVGCNLGEDGTGGFLFLNVRGNLKISENANIVSIGSRGGSGSGGVSGGSSGGGIITILYAGLLDNKGRISAAGGAVKPAGTPGGAGGDGSVIGPLKISNGYDACNYGERRVDGVCEIIKPESCKEVLNLGIGTLDGIYEIDPDGPGKKDSINAYCDMTTEGGGWTLTMALPSNVNLWNYEIPIDSRHSFNSLYENSGGRYVQLTEHSEELFVCESENVARNYTRTLKIPEVWDFQRNNYRILIDEINGMPVNYYMSRCYNWGGCNLDHYAYGVYKDGFNSWGSLSNEKWYVDEHWCNNINIKKDNNGWFWHYVR